MSDAHNKATIKYNRSRDQIMIKPDKETGAQIRAAAQAAGKPVQRYILDILLEYVSGDSDGTAGRL